MKRLLLVLTITITALIASAAYSKPEPIPHDDSVLLMEQNISTMDKKIHDLEEQLNTLKRSHEMAILINQDLDERISKLEEKQRN